MMGLFTGTGPRVLAMALLCGMAGASGAFAQTGGSASGSTGSSGAPSAGLPPSAAGPAGTGPRGTGTSPNDPTGPAPAGQARTGPELTPSPPPIENPSSPNPALQGLPQLPSTGAAEAPLPTPAPSTGNADVTSPIERQVDRQVDRIERQGAGSADNASRQGQRAPTPDTYPGGGGSGTGASTGESDNLDVSRTRREDTISGEPDRVKRGGAGGKTMADCMAIWDPSTHMSKEQWRTTCERLGN
jgi:hypothetical protein